jgi:putative sigma-54 modulation protein
MVGDLTAAVDAKQRVRWVGGVKAQKRRIGPAAQGVTGLMLKQQHSGGAFGILEQTLLQLPLLLPGLGKRHQPRRFKKDCVAAGPAHQPFLALVNPELRRARGSMKLLIHGRNLEVTPAIREYTETKLTRAINHFDGLVKEADVHLSVARNPRVPQQTAEVTMFANGTVIRAQERSDNLYSSIDLVASKLTRQLNRFRERLHERNHGPVHRSARDEEAGAAALPPPGSTLTDGLEASTPSRGVRRKYFAMPPMSVDDALQQLDVIDHDFFVFRDSDTGQIQVAYRRNHGGYGVIQAKD